MMEREGVRGSKGRYTIHYQAIHPGLGNILNVILTIQVTI